MKKSQLLLLQIFSLIILMFVSFGISAQNITYLNKYEIPIRNLDAYEPAYYNMTTFDEGKILVKMYSMDSILRSEKHTLHLNENIAKEVVLYLAEYNEDGNLFHYQKRIDINKVFDQRFYDDGKIQYQKVLLDNKVIEESYYDEGGNPRTKIVESKPEPRGGMPGWHKHLSKNIKYPKQARSKGEEGTAWLYFKIDEEGKIHDLDLMNPEDISPDLAKEALRMLEIYPHKWVPAKYDGKPICKEMRLPLRFKI